MERPSNISDSEEKTEENNLMEELVFVVKNSKIDVSSGPDGYPNEFYKTF